ncbi:ATP-binding protein [Nonomuraea salmonea]|uniref:ATP-binding protein n=1 Tax=Nonomuraea salmonea TaxID=46181 RepID=UPI0031E6DF6A
MNEIHVRRRSPSDALPPALIGRDDAMAAMVAAVSQDALVLVEGEAGIGKSRLLDECLADPALRGRTVLMAACPPLREPFPLGAVVDGLRVFDDRLGELALSPLAGALRTLFPEWAAWLPPALEALPDPQETRHRLFRALGELIDALGVDVLVVEDAHWADTATLDWLLTLTTSRGAARSIVVTYRPLEVGEGSPLLRLTSRPPRNMSWERIALEPLDVPQTGALVKSMFATADVSDRFAAFLHEHTGGIPLALEETVRLLRARRDIFRSETGWRRRITEELRVPPTVRDSVLERVTRLDPATRAVLEAAAVLEAPAGEALIAAVADLDEAAVQDGLAVALASGLLRESGRGAFCFNHVLASRAVAEATPIPSRRRLHHRAALALREGEHPPVVRLCRHFRESGDVEEWCRYAEAASELAMEAGDGHTTVAMMLDLLTAADHPVERLVRLARRLGAAVSVTAEPLLGLGERVRAALEETLAHPGLPAEARGRAGAEAGAAPLPPRRVRGRDGRPGGRHAGSGGPARPRRPGHAPAGQPDDPRLAASPPPGVGRPGGAALPAGQPAGRAGRVPVPPGRGAALPRRGGRLARGARPSRRRGQPPGAPGDRPGAADGRSVLYVMGPARRRTRLPGLLRGAGGTGGLPPDRGRAEAGAGAPGLARRALGRPGRRGGRAGRLGDGRRGDPPGGPHDPRLPRPGARCAAAGRAAAARGPRRQPGARARGPVHLPRRGAGQDPARARRAGGRRGDHRTDAGDDRPQGRVAVGHGAAAGPPGRAACRRADAGAVRSGGGLRRRDGGT